MQRKAFYRHRIPELSCVRKETIDIDILPTSRNGDRKIIQYIRITSRPPLIITKWNQLSQFRWTSTYRKDLSWLHFDRAASEVDMFINIRPIFQVLCKLKDCKVFSNVTAVGLFEKILLNTITYMHWTIWCKCYKWVKIAISK